MTEDDLEKKIVDLLSEEYKTLRQESLNTINNRISIMGYSFATLAIVGSVTVSSKVPDLIVALILGFAVPVLAKTVTHVWIGEYQRSQRAGAFIAVLEERINVALGSDILTWESRLRRDNTKLTKPYTATVALFLLIGVISETFSLYYWYGAASHVVPHPDTLYHGVVTWLSMVVFFLLMSYMEAIGRFRVRAAWEASAFYASRASVPSLAEPAAVPLPNTDLKEQPVSAFDLLFYKFHTRWIDELHVLTGRVRGAISQFRSQRP